MSYNEDAWDDAQSMADEFRDEIEEQLVRDDAAQEGWNRYVGIERYHHEKHIDRAYGVDEALELLDELLEFQEMETERWEGMQPEDALGVKAAYTYANAVVSAWDELILNINEEYSELLPDEDDYANADEYEAAKKKVAEIAVNRVIERGSQELNLPKPTPPPEQKATKKKGRGFEFFN